MTHSQKNKYQGRHLVKTRSSGYKEQQQGCPNTQRRFVDEKKQDNEQEQNSKGNSKE